MEKIIIELTISSDSVPKPKPTKSYMVGHFIGKLFRKLKRANSLEAKVEKIVNKDWSKDYSDLETPTVLRKPKTDD